MFLINFALENKFHVKPNTNKYDVVVVGGGHAGIEAAVAAANRGVNVVLVTMEKKALARMSCNPAIGGLAKGQMVREIDVLGGLMPKMADRAGIQFKLLNRSKGRSVWSPRAQVDKRAYEQAVISKISNQLRIDTIEGEVVNILVQNQKINGVVLRAGINLYARSIILTCGTFLKGIVHIGQRKIFAGRMGESSSIGITEALESYGFHSGRLKTGTPPRLLKSSIDWLKTGVIEGDKTPVPFSYSTKNFNPPNIPCHVIKTNSECHNIISENISKSPMFTGEIMGVGPRYCPSIEDKIFRFSHHNSHLLFLEPEWTNSDQIYVNGFSTSLPAQVQLEALQQIPGLEKVRFLRPGYAIEYDFFPPSQHKASLESKNIQGLFFAGQINGTSGYEEAAAQGLIAGINSVCYIYNQEPMILSRDEAYIGVLIDDLITKDTFEPYRMFTSRAEHRLMLRYTNADRRLLKKSKRFGLIDTKTFETFLKKKEATDSILSELKRSITPEAINSTLAKYGEPPIVQKQPANKLLKRPSISIYDIPSTYYKNANLAQFDTHIADEILTEAETMVKYKGYIDRQNELIGKMKRQEEYKLPVDINYGYLKSLSLEAREELTSIRPETLGQAMRISGVSPADISILSVLLHKTS
jgi:tRNA uridine 5-carboxymethylaminomethyl modification enzyme